VYTRRSLTTSCSLQEHHHVDQSVGSRRVSLRQPEQIIDQSSVDQSAARGRVDGRLELSAREASVIDGRQLGDTSSFRRSRDTIN